MTNCIKIKLFLVTCLCMQYKMMSILNNLNIMHGISNPLIKYNPHEIQVIMALASLKADLIAQLQPYKSHISGGNNIRVFNDVSIRSSLYKQDNPEIMGSDVMGLVVMKNDGRIMLSKQGTEIELLTSSQLVFRYFLQSFAYENEKEVIKHTYIICDAQNMYLIQRPFTPRFHMEAQFDPYKTIIFTCTNEDVQNL
ncbi:uncharacterized protein EV154DRAFT_476713 [Mucor mucedo]|uniref:uncharacterized protein n=1 Tax=Mucor mucedo TaxID=29922 RepID=UPI00221E51F3|nr:uncharacterized protein EV154DRAFT_476713 [Mucor mucedo]KAI7896349.1 hypothetical protein EV154DRAFT_476713 [Mucor mucedo]